MIVGQVTLVPPIDNKYCNQTFRTKSPCNRNISYHRFQYKHNLPISMHETESKSWLLFVSFGVNTSISKWTWNTSWLYVNERISLATSVLDSCALPQTMKTPFSPAWLPKTLIYIHIYVSTYRPYLIYKIFYIDILIR